MRVKTLSKQNTLAHLSFVFNMTLRLNAIVLALNEYVKFRLIYRLIIAEVNVLLFLLATCCCWKMCCRHLGRSFER
jgi:hypothetical protein